MESDFDEGAYTKKCSGGFLITVFLFRCWRRRIRRQRELRCGKERRV